MPHLDHPPLASNIYSSALNLLGTDHIIPRPTNPHLPVVLRQESQDRRRNEEKKEEETYSSDNLNMYPCISTHFQCSSPNFLALSETSLARSSFPPSEEAVVQKRTKRRYIDLNNLLGLADCQL